ncbi:hypothetical protein B7494_g6696 [Chlorociboria aeruginascens]|nr:hypothetical protein B7494_g6696 [Chlorociboria aeruginascens]
MGKQLFERFDGVQITESMLQEASVLFSKNYGVWGEQGTGKFAKPGSRVRLSKERLRSQCLPDNEICSYVRVTVDDQLAGNAFACHWTANNKSVCWVTQLVVDRNYRERGLAKGLLNQLKRNDIDIYGLMSSHPAACLASAKAFGDSISTIKLGFIRRYAEEVMKASPITYIKDAKLRGSVFTPGDTSGLVSSVDSGFFVDHSEPLEVLASVREDMEWPLGELFDGHEFFLIFEAKRRSRSRFTSTPDS